MVISQFLISHGLPLGFALDFALNSTLFLFPLDFAFKKLFRSIVVLYSVFSGITLGFALNSMLLLFSLDSVLIKPSFCFHRSFVLDLLLISPLVSP